LILHCFLKPVKAGLFKRNQNSWSWRRYCLEPEASRRMMERWFHFGRKFMGFLTAMMAFVTPLLPLKTES